MKTLYRALDQANKQGRLGLIVYAMPDFPSPSEYRSVVSMLEETAFVSAVETSDGGVEQLGSHQSESLVNAHRVVKDSVKEKQPDAMARVTNLTTVYVLYPQKVAEYEGRWAEFVTQYEKRIDAVTVEGGFDLPRGLMPAFENSRLEVVQAISPVMRRKRLTELVASTHQQSTVYLSSAKMAGGAFFGQKKIRKCAALVKMIRPDLKIAVGLGIRTAKQVAELAVIPQIDGVVIGSAFVEAMGKGVTSVAEFLAAIGPALQRL